MSNIFLRCLSFCLSNHLCEKYWYTFLCYLNNHLLSLFYRYTIPWYRASLNIQKMILFLLQRNNKDFVLNIGGIFIASLECFASVKLRNPRIYIETIVHLIQ